MQKTLIVVLSVVVGAALLIAAGMYAFTPAHSLPSFFPGFEMSSKIHYKHAIGSFFLSLAVFAFAWFQTGKKSSK